MKLLVLVLSLTSCLGQQDLPREVKWDYSEWQPILAPCPTCRHSRILEAKPAHISTVAVGKPILPQSEDETSAVAQPPPEDTSSVIQLQPEDSSSVLQLQPEDSSSVIQLQPVFLTNLPEIKPENFVKTIPPTFKTNPSEINAKNLVPSTPPRTPAISFPPTKPGFPLTPAVPGANGVNQVRLVYLPEGSIQQLSSANAARIIPTSQVPNQIRESIDSIPPLPSPQVIQSIDFSDKQKRDHEGRIVSGGATNSLPMSLITTRGHENDAREKLKLLEAALSAPLEQESEKLPRVFIAPSHVPPPPGYVKIPLVPQGKSESHGNEPLPPTFLTPDSRNPPPGFVKFDLPSTVSKLSKDIPVVVPNSQVEPNVIFSGPTISSTPGPIRPDAALNIQAQNLRTGKNIISGAQISQVIPKEESKPTIPPKSLVPSDQAVTEPRRPPGPLNSLRPIPQRPAPLPQNGFQTQFFPPRQPPHFPQQSIQNLNQPHPFAHRPGQPLPLFPGQPVVQPLPHSGQFFPRPGQQFVQHNPSTPRPDNHFVQSNQVFPNQGIPRPLPPFPQAGQPHNQQFLHSGQPVLQPGQGFPRIIQHFQQPNHPLPHPGQRPVNTNPNQSVFRSPNAPVQSDFPDINSNSLNQPENSNHESVTPVPSPSSSLQTIPPLVNAPHSVPKSVIQNTPRPQLISPFPQKEFPSSSPTPTTFFQSSPRPFPSTESPVFPQRPTSFSTPEPVSLTPLSSPNPFSSSRSPTTITPVPVSLDSHTVGRSGFSSTERPERFTTPVPFTSPESVTFTTPRPAPFPTQRPAPFITQRPAPFTTQRPVPFTTQRPAPFTTQRPAPFTTQRPAPFTTPEPIPFTTPRPAGFTTQRPAHFTTPTPSFITTPRPILTSSHPPFSSLNPQPVTFSPLPLFETSSPRNPFQQAFGIEETELETLPPLPHEHQSIEISGVNEPQIPFIQEPHVQSAHPQVPVSPQFTPSEEPVTVRIPSFQRPQTTTLTRFPGGSQSPRLPAFQRPSPSLIAENENSKEIQETGRRQRLPLFPRFQRPRVTTVVPEEEDQTLQPEILTTEFIPTTTPSTLSTPSQPTTVKVTTFKPKFNFNLGNRRPFFRRKQRPTEEDEKKEKIPDDKKPEPVTLFPPFSVARTLNPQRDDKKEVDKTSTAGEPGVTVPPSGTFGRRIRPRTKSPSARSNDESDAESPRPSGVRARGPVSNRARELPDWLKARRRVRGRFRGLSSTTTENARVVDDFLEDDIPLDAIENNEFSGAESTLVVFSRPLENAVSGAVVGEEIEKVLDEEGDIKYEEQSQEEKQIKSDDEQVAEVVTDYSEGNSNIHHESSVIPEDIIASADAGVSVEPQDAAESYEDYTYESTESVPEPEPEPESSDKYVADYSKYEDDTEDTSETYNTHDQPRRQPPSFPNPQPTQQTVIHTSAHSHPLIIPKIPSVENSEINPVETLIDHTVDEVEDATERYVGNESSDENELVALLPIDKETAELNLDIEVDVENEYDSVTKRTNFSHENNSSEIDNETYQLGGEGEEGAEGEMDGESQEHREDSREDSYQEYSTEPPEILTLFPNDYFTALSPGQLQEYDYYEYDSYEDEGSIEGVDQNFGGSSAQVVFAVPVTEYYPEDTTWIQEQFESTEENVEINDSEVAVPTTEEAFPMTTEELEVGMEGNDATTDYPSLDEDEDEPVTESQVEYDEVTPYYNIVTEIPEEEVPVSTLDDSESFVSTENTTAVPTTTVPPATTVPVLNNISTPSTTTPRPASIRPLYARLQSIGKKEAEVAIKKLGRHPKILGQSTVTEIRSSDPVICFRDNQCVRARGQRRRGNYKP
ncbi:mucin-2-like [Macrobrachium nipponense]|uniref:mucin-2-like n=1 Tax=Macrobrachium nipponense TaxID=159736 RepID=UPI0030C85EF7